MRREGIRWSSAGLDLKRGQRGEEKCGTVVRTLT